MNERIRELAKQADFIGKKNNGAEWRWGYIDPELAEKLEKFAELVVKETIDEMITQMWNYGIDESNNPQFYKIIDRTIQEMLNVAPSKD